MLAALLIGVSIAQAADGVWTLDGNGLWSDIANWNSGAGPIADGVGSTADFTTIDLTNKRTVTIDGAVLSPTVGILNLGQPLDNRGYSFNQTNSGTLVFDGGGSPAEITNFNTTTGSNGNTRPYFQVPIVLYSDLNINNMGTNKTPSNPLQLKTNEFWFNQQGIEGAAATGDTVYLSNVSTGTAVIWGHFGNGKLNDGPNGGKLGVIQDGNNALWLASNPVGNYSGGTFIKKGLLIVSQSNPGTGPVHLGDIASNDASFLMTGNNKNVNISSPINLTSGAVGTLTIGGGNGYIATFSGPIDLNGEGLTLAPDKASSTARLTGVITGPGTIDGGGTGVAKIESVIPASVTSISNSSAGSNLALSGANAYTDTHTITAGALTFLNQGAINGGVASVVPAKVAVSAGATLGLGVGSSPTCFDSADVATVLAQMSLPAGANVGLDTTAGDFTYASAVTGGIGLTKLGTNTLTLSGTNTYTGATTISAGTLAVAAGDSLPPGGILNIGAGGTLTADAAGVTLAGATVNLTAGSTLSTTAAGTLTIDASTTITGNLNTAGDGLLTIANATYAGTITNTGNVTVSGSTLTGNVLTKGPGTLTIDNSTVSGGTMKVHYAGSLVISGGSQVTSRSSEVGMWGQGQDCSATVTGAGTLWNTGSTGYFMGDRNPNNSLLITDGGTVISRASDIGHGVNVGSRNGSNNTVTIQNGGRWDLTGGPNYSLYVGNQWGGDSVHNNLLAVKDGGSLVNLTSVYIAIDGKYRVAGTANGVDNKLIVESGGVIEFVTATPTILVNDVGTGNEFSLLSGATLSYKDVADVDMNANTDAGNDVSKIAFAGNNTLRLNNSTSATNYTFSNALGATNYAGLDLDGGTASGTIAVAGSGTLSGGGTIGVLEMDNGSTYVWELSDAGNDLIAVSGALTLGTAGSGLITIDLVGNGFTGDPLSQTYEIASYGTLSAALGAVTFTSSDFNVFSAVLTDDPGDKKILLSGVRGGGAVPGDANGNGFVDDDDLAVLLSNWEADAGTITTWQLGDFTGDTDVDDDDLAVLLGNWTGPPPGGAAVPEPATLALLALGGLSVLRRRRRSCLRP